MLLFSFLGSVTYKTPTDNLESNHQFTIKLHLTSIQFIVMKLITIAMYLADN